MPLGCPREGRPFRSHRRGRQFELLDARPVLDSIGIRPLGMREGDLRATYALGFVPFGGMSWCSFADAAHAMVAMLQDDT